MNAVQLQKEEPSRESLTTLAANFYSEDWLTAPHVDGPCTVKDKRVVSITAVTLAVAKEPVCVKTIFAKQ